MLFCNTATLPGLQNLRVGWFLQCIAAAARGGNEASSIMPSDFHLSSTSHSHEVKPAASNSSQQGLLLAAGGGRRSSCASEGGGSVSGSVSLRLPVTEVSVRNIQMITVVSRVNVGELTTTILTRQQRKRRAREQRELRRLRRQKRARSKANGGMRAAGMKGGGARARKRASSKGCLSSLCWMRNPLSIKLFRKKAKALQKVGSCESGCPSD
jgi:hypothetical protein